MSCAASRYKWEWRQGGGCVIWLWAPQMPVNAQMNDFGLSWLPQWAGNIFSLGAIVGAFLGWLPAFAAAIALTWYLIQIFESHTVQRWLHTRRERKIAHYMKRVHELRAQQKVIDPKQPDVI